VVPSVGDGYHTGVNQISGKTGATELSGTDLAVLVHDEV
jgi:hypothetical protein